MGRSRGMRAPTLPRAERSWPTSRQQLERVAMAGADDREVAAVGGQEPAQLLPLADGGDRRVDEADVRVGVAVDQRERAAEIVGDEWLKLHLALDDRREQRFLRGRAEVR